MIIIDEQLMFIHELLIYVNEYFDEQFQALILFLAFVNEAIVLRMKTKWVTVLVLSKLK